LSNRSKAGGEHEWKGTKMSGVEPGVRNRGRQGAWKGEWSGRARLDEERNQNELPQRTGYICFATLARFV
jgi:hypothetical protein